MLKTNVKRSFSMNDIADLCGTRRNADTVLGRVGLARAPIGPDRYEIVPQETDEDGDYDWYVVAENLIEVINRKQGRRYYKNVADFCGTDSLERSVLLHLHWTQYA
jgi:hypothetical protein